MQTKIFACGLGGEEEGRAQEVCRMYRAQVYNQAASNISSSGKVLECLVSRQGLGRTQMLLENPLLIFDWLCAAVQRQSLRGWRGCTVVDLFRWVGFGGTSALSVVGKMVIRPARATCSGGPALWREAPQFQRE